MSWKKVKLGDICTSQYGYTASACDEDTGTKFLRITDIVPRNIDWSTVPFCPIDEKEREKYLLHKGDIVVARTGATVGYAKYIREETQAVFASYLVRFIVNKANIDKAYVGLCIESQMFKDYIASIANGSAQPNANSQMMSAFELPLPDLPTQQKIASILSAYDDLIDNNLKQIKLLEEAAQRLYTEWFVDLHFPEYENTPFVDGLPKGWKNEKIGNFVEYFDKKRKPLSSMQRASMQKLYPYYGASSLMDYVDDYIFDGIYLLMGEDGTVITPDNFPILQYIWGKFWVNNHAHVLRGKNGISTEFLYIHFKKMPVTDVVTGVAQPKISQGRLSDKKVILPSIDLIKKWSDLTKPFFEQIRNLSCAITQLQEARDLLLPRLMSGELNVE